MVAILRSSGAATTVIALYWFKKPWYVHMAKMASKTINMPPKRYIFSPQKLLGQGRVGPFAKSVVSFRILKPIDANCVCVSFCGICWANRKHAFSFSNQVLVNYSITSG